MVLANRYSATTKKDAVQLDHKLAADLRHAFFLFNEYFEHDNLRTVYAISLSNDRLPTIDPSNDRWCRPDFAMRTCSVLAWL